MLLIEESGIVETNPSELFLMYIRYSIIIFLYWVEIYKKLEYNNKQF